MAATRYQSAVYVGVVTLLFPLLDSCTTAMSLAGAQKQQRQQQPNTQPFSWVQWHPFLGRRLLQSPAPFPDGPSAVTLVGREGGVLGSAAGRTDKGPGPTLGTSSSTRDDIGSQDKKNGGGGGGDADGADDSSMRRGEVGASMSLASHSNGTQAVDTLGAAASEEDSCHTITIYLRAMQVIHSLVDEPNSKILFQCQTNTGRRYKWYPIPIEAAYERGYGDAKLSLQLAVAQLKCGEAMSCRVVGQWDQPNGNTANAPLFDWTSSGCWFQYWHFASMHDQSPLWSCRDENVGEYVLQCIDCPTADKGTYPAASSGSRDLAAGGGGRGASINPSIIIIATCVCSGTAIVVGLALLIRHRRRTRSMNARIVELLQRAEDGGRGGGRGGGSGPHPDFKPPPLFELDLGAGKGCGGQGEGEDGGVELPPQRPPTPGYKGPIVVLNYDGTPEWGCNPGQGALLLAVSELSGGAAQDGGWTGTGGARRQHRRSHRHHRRQLGPLPPVVDAAAVVGPEGAGGAVSGEDAAGRLPGVGLGGEPSPAPGRHADGRATGSGRLSRVPWDTALSAADRTSSSNSSGFARDAASSSRRSPVPRGADAPPPDRSSEHRGVSSSSRRSPVPWDSPLSAPDRYSEHRGTPSSSRRSSPVPWDLPLAVPGRSSEHRGIPSSSSLVPRDVPLAAPDRSSGLPRGASSTARRSPVPWDAPPGTSDQTGSAGVVSSSRRSSDGQHAHAGAVVRPPWPLPWRVVVGSGAEQDPASRSGSRPSSRAQRDPTDVQPPTCPAGVVVAAEEVAH